MNIEWRLASFPLLPAFGEFDKWIPGKLYAEVDSPQPVDENRKIRIIVIDDETLIAETVAEILKQEGFEAAAVSNGQSAIELATMWQPDILLSDVVMPGLNGIETGIKIREVVPTCKIILFSGQAATVDLLEDARHRGHRFDILAKPIKPEQLISVIRSTFAS